MIHLLGLRIFQNVKIIFELSTIQWESATELRFLINEIQSHVKALKGLGQNTDEWDVLLIHLTLTKLEKDSEGARNFRLLSNF